MMETKARVIMIGNYLDTIGAYLKHSGIACNELICSCNPLAMVGSINSKYVDEYKNINSMQTQLNIRKNLSQMLSVDEKDYCNNYNIVPIGRNCEYSNTAEYIVVCNTNIAYDLFFDGEYLYSDIWPQNDFTKMLKSNKSFKKVPFPFKGTFNWKYYYDLFIDAIMSVYDKEHIILLKTNSAQWHYKDKVIAPSGEKSSLFRNQIQEIDNYFAKKTHCIVVNETYNHIPAKQGEGAFVYAIQSKYSNECAAQQIADIILNNKTNEKKVHSSDNRLANVLQNKLTDILVDESKSDLQYIADIGISYLRFDVSCDEVGLLNKIKSLKRFLNPLENYTLSNYVENILYADDVDIEMILDYTRFFKLDINDIVSVYYLCKIFDRKSDLIPIVKNLLDNKSAAPITTAQKLRNKNIEFLLNYKYLSENLKNFSVPKRTIIKIDEHLFFAIDPQSDSLIELVDYDACDDYCGFDIINNGNICNLQQACRLCSDLSFYIERARRNEGNKPINLQFDSAEEFYESLFYIDYGSLLDNELFLIGLNGDGFEATDYKARCDLSFLFKKETKLFVLHSGFTDQLCYYLFARVMEGYSDTEIYFDDLMYYHGTMFNGEEIHKISKGNFKKRMLSNILTPKLLTNYDKFQLAPDKLIENGLTNLAIISTDEKRSSEIKKGNKIYFIPSPVELLENIFKYDSNVFLKYYYCMIRPEWMMQIKHFELDDYIQFPPMQDKNKIIEESMLNSDAIVIHVRRGDFVNWGWEADNEFYVEAISMLLKIPDYTNKKYFVFSDDIPWVKAHGDEMGLDLVGNDEIIYVDHNKNETSYLDMYLMSLGKVIIGSGSGFVRMAALYSKRCEDFICYNHAVMDNFNNYVRRNRHDFTDFSKQYGINYSVRAPKKTEAGNNSHVSLTPQNVKVSRLERRANTEWLNFWFDRGYEQRDDRILLMGDSVTREYRSALAQIIKRPVDFFATTASISSERFYETLDLFFSYEEYRQKKAHIQVGLHGIDGFCGAIHNNSIEEFEKDYEKMVTTVLKYVPDVTVALLTPVVKANDFSQFDEKVNNEVLKRNEIIKKIGQKYKLSVNDLYALMRNEIHRDFVHYPKEGSEKIARKVAEVMKLL